MRKNTDKYTHCTPGPSSPRAPRHRGPRPSATAGPEPDAGSSCLAAPGWGCSPCPARKATAFSACSEPRSGATPREEPLGSCSDSGAELRHGAFRSALQRFSHPNEDLVSSPQSGLGCERVNYQTSLNPPSHRRDLGHTQTVTDTAHQLPLLPLSARATPQTQIRET